MADRSPEDARNDPEEAKKATRESTGHSIEGDTPPAEGLGVGPTNPDMDVEKPGEGAKNKVWLVLVLVLVVVFVVLAIIGRFAGFF
ncbi:MAG: DUF6480 family protein [Micrococcus sp.]|nr:DUF6480 family protein [Micrococcus sp.]